MVCSARKEWWGGGGSRVVAITALTLYTIAVVFSCYFKGSLLLKLQKTGFRVQGKKRVCLLF